MRCLLAAITVLFVPLPAQAQSGTITGTVTDARTGAPLANIEVSIFNGTATDEVFTTTNASGVYTLSGVNPGTYIVAAFPDDGVNYFGELYPDIMCGIGCGLEFLDATPITVTGGGTVPNINFTLTPGGTITGTVTNAANGNPITNVNVTAVVLIGTQAVTVDTVATNSTGAYSISLLPEGRVYLYTGNTQGFVNEIYDNIPCIGLCSGSTATTGTAVQVKHGETTPGRNFALDPGGRITGTITNSVTGAPVANVTVNANFKQGGGSTVQVATGTSNASGVYTVGGLPTGTYSASTSVGNTGVLGELYDNIRCPLQCNGTMLAAGADIPVTVGALVSNRNFALDPGASISGQVTDQATGQPVANVTVTVVTRIGGISGNFTTRSATTNAQGRYTAAGLTPGTYWAFTSNTQGFVNEIFDNIICVSGCSNNTAAATGAAIQVAAGVAVSDRNFALQRGGRISGTLRDASGRSELVDNNTGVELYLQSGSTRTFIASFRPDNDGQYTFGGLAAGSYVLWTVDSGAGTDYRNYIYNGIPCDGPCSAMTTAPTLVPVAVGANVTGVDFSMERAAYLFGKVTSATGQPLEGVAVNLYRRTGSGVFQGTSTSGPNGWYAFFGLVPGSFVAFTSNSLGYVNEIHDNVVCASTCSAATAVSTGTPIEVPDPTSILGFAAVNFALDLRNAAPGAPTNLRAVATGTGVEFSWTPPTSSTTGVAATYVIEAGAAPGATLVTLQAGTATRYTVPAVPPGVFYIRVRAQNAAGLGPVSNEVTLPMSASGAAPDAPINPQAFTNGNLLTFTWAPATTGGAPTGYVVEAGSSSGAANLATMPVSAPFFTYSPVPDGFYFLRVRATNAGGVSAPSAEQMIVVGNVTAPTSPPSFNSSPVSGSTVTLNWSAPAIGTATSYLIEAGSAPGLSNLASANTGNANTTISFSGVPRGTYYVRIRAVNAAGASLPSNERTITVQ